MNRRKFIRTTCFSTAALSLTLHASGADSQSSASRPNIIFLFADDWGWGDLGCHGNKLYKTPNLDTLASQGTDFTQFNVCNPVCSPSRTAVMTGQFPARYGVHQHFAAIDQNKQRGMPDWLETKTCLLPRLFKNAGYKTGHFGKWHLTNTGCDDAPDPSEYGYDESAVFNGPGPQVSAADSGTYDKTIEFIKKHKENPFFINVWMHQTHTPHFPKKQFLASFKDLNEREKVYAAIVAEGDHGVGRILKTLDELNLTDNTLVVFSSDNGPEVTGKKKSHFDRSGKAGKKAPGLGTFYSVGSTAGLKGRKRSLFEGGVRVPFIVRWPGRTPAGKKNNTTVIAAVDLLPTFCKAANIELPRDYKPDGEDMLDVFAGSDRKRQRPIFWEWRGPGAGHNWPRLGVRDGDWKIVITYDDKRTELYNVINDREEQHNIAADHPDIVKKLSEMAHEWKGTLPEEPPKSCISKFRK